MNYSTLKGRTGYFVRILREIPNDRKMSDSDAVEKVRYNEHMFSLHLRQRSEKSMEQNGVRVGIDFQSMTPRYLNSHGFGLTKADQQRFEKEIDRANTEQYKAIKRKMGKEFPIGWQDYLNLFGHTHDFVMHVETDMR